MKMWKVYDNYNDNDDNDDDDDGQRTNCVQKSTPEPSAQVCSPDLPNFYLKLNFEYHGCNFPTILLCIQIKPFYIN